jgi:hypothetical protein
MTMVLMVLMLMLSGDDGASNCLEDAAHADRIQVESLVRNAP